MKPKEEERELDKQTKQNRNRHQLMKHKIEGGETGYKPNETQRRRKRNRKKQEQASADETLGRRRRNR